MKNTLKRALSTSAIVTALAIGSVFYAHAADTPKPQAPGSMMHGGQGDMMGMMNMMQQMNQMMESCNAMMKDTKQRAPQSPQDQKKPAQGS